jgi:hypothetical protein
MTVNCSGIQLEYWEESGNWQVELETKDVLGAFNYTRTGDVLTYNTLISAIVSPLITFGSLARGSIYNLNTNIPAWNMTNCGNVNLSTFITGMNITNGGSQSMDISNFKVSDDAVSGGDIILNESSIDLTSLVYIAPALNSYQNLWFFVDIPSSQYPTTYDNGYWVWTPFEP